MNWSSAQEHVPVDDRGWWLQHVTRIGFRLVRIAHNLRIYWRSEAEGCGYLTLAQARSITRGWKSSIASGSSRVAAC